MPRRVVRPFGASVTATRGVSMLVGLVVLGLLYDTASKPRNWGWLSKEHKSDQIAASEITTSDPASFDNSAEQFDDTTDGKDDRAPGETERFTGNAGLVRDRTNLMRREMTAYWQLMEWSNAQTFNQMNQRSLVEPSFSELWEDPDRFRGKLIRLRLNVRRVIKYEAPANDVDVKEVFEAWGWTDNSKSYPYVVVFSKAPVALPIGADVECEVRFVGYFLKIMAYSAHDKPMGAPLLVGRAELVESNLKRHSLSHNKSLNSSLFPMALGLLGLSVIYVLLKRNLKGSRNATRKLNGATSGEDLSEIDVSATTSEGTDNDISHKTLDLNNLKIDT